MVAPKSQHEFNEGDPCYIVYSNETSCNRRLRNKTILTVVYFQQERMR